MRGRVLWLGMCRCGSSGLVRIECVGRGWRRRGLLCGGRRPVDNISSFISMLGIYLICGRHIEWWEWKGVGCWIGGGKGKGEAYFIPTKTIKIHSQLLDIHLPMRRIRHSIYT